MLINMRYYHSSIIHAFSSSTELPSMQHITHFTACARYLIYITNYFAKACMSKE